MNCRYFDFALGVRWVAPVSSAVSVAGTTAVSLSGEVANARCARASGPSSNSDATPWTAAQQVSTSGLGSPAGARPLACASTAVAPRSPLTSVPTGWYVPSVAAASAKDKLLDASLSLIRERGFAATTVDDICGRAGVTKGAFFHHFESKAALGVAAVEHWSRTTGALFHAARYHQAPDALGRVRAYLALRKSLIRGGLAEFTCLAGTLVQETYALHPTIRAACADSIFGHADTLVEDLAAAMKDRGIGGDFTPESLAAHTQCVLQGAFILAKARGDARIAVESIEHLERYVELLFNVRTRRGAHAS